MVQPIGGSSPGYYSQSTTQTPDLNSIGNDLWLSTYFLFNYKGLSDDAVTFQLAMKGIQHFMDRYPASGPGPQGDSYLYGVWEDLTSTNGGHGSSLASLASNYAAHGYNSTDLSAFNAFLSDHSVHSIYATFASDINAWGTKEGGFMKNPQLFTIRTLNNLLSDFPLTSSNFATFLADIKTASDELNSSTPPLDGCCQFLKDFLNIPLDPTNTTPSLAALTLAGLATSTDTTDLKTLLNNNPSIEKHINDILNQISIMEK